MCFYAFYPGSIYSLWRYWQLETRNALNSLIYVIIRSDKNFVRNPTANQIQQKKKKTQKVERDDSSGGPRLGRLGPLLQPHYQNIMEDDQINWSPTVDDRLQAALRENVRTSKIIS